MIVGLTGGIGSGKSEASKRFERLGITIVDADIIAREAVAPNSAALNAIATHFGQTILNTDGSLNRNKLRAIIFENQVEKNWLESLLHPLIRNIILERLAASATTYTILSSPLLFESKQHELVDRVLVIDASEELQLMRACARDNSNLEHIKNIMSAQLSRAERNKNADDIIKNNDDLVLLGASVLNLHQKYLSLAATHQATHLK